MYLAKSEKCTGCSACVNICPKKCISMIENKEGFLEPKIDQSNCISCQLCTKTCPVINTFSINQNEKPKTFACFAKSADILMKTSSGGVFPLLAMLFLNNGGIVYGASFASNGLIIHKRIDHIDNLDDILGSKYVQSQLDDIFLKVKEDLDKRKKVLFSGTPCQIAGLYSFLKKNYDNLLTVDLICHGVPSPKAWKMYLQAKNIINIEKINFRNKDMGWEKFQLKIIGDTNNILESKDKNSYMKSFLHNLSLRKCCYQCNFRKINRISDITLGDLWGCNSIIKNMYNEKGVSVVIIHSHKGQVAFNQIQNDIKWKNIDIENIVKYNPALLYNVKENKHRKKFLEKLSTVNFKSLVDQYTKVTVTQKIKYKLDIYFHKRSGIGE